MLVHGGNLAWDSKSVASDPKIIASDLKSVAWDLKSVAFDPKKVGLLNFGIHHTFKRSCHHPEILMQPFWDPTAIFSYFSISLVIS